MYCSTNFCIASLKLLASLQRLFAIPCVLAGLVLHQAMVAEDDMIEIKCKHVSAKIALVRMHLGTLEREIADIRVLNATSKKRKVSEEVAKEVVKGIGNGNGGDGSGGSSGGEGKEVVLPVGDVPVTVG